MATAPIVPAITLVVGQQVEISLTVTGAGSGTVWLSCDDPTVVTPVTLGGAPLTWPSEVALSADSGIFFLEGTAPGVATISFLSEIDPPDPENSDASLGSLEVIVLGTGEDDPPGGEGDPAEPMSIAEPIVILLALQPPAGGPV